MQTALSTFYTTNALGSSKSSLSLPVLALLYTGLVFFGPSGFGWIYHKWRIDTKIFQGELKYVALPSPAWRMYGLTLPPSSPPPSPPSPPSVYTYFAFTMNLVPTLFLCGAPGLIVVLGLCNGLASFHGVDLNR